MDKLTLKNKKIIIFIQAAAYSLIIIGLVLIFGKKSWWPSYYNPNYYGLIFLVSALLIISSGYILKPLDYFQKKALIFFRLTLTLVLIFNALGELYLYQLYKYGFQYDKLTHFVNSFLLAATLIYFYEKWYDLSLKRALKNTIIIIVVGGLFWEVFEFLSDFFFKTSEFGVYGQFKVADTAFDILANSLGVTASSIFMAWRGRSSLHNKSFFYKRRISSGKALTGRSCLPNMAIK